MNKQNLIIVIIISIIAAFVLFVMISILAMVIYLGLSAKSTMVNNSGSLQQIPSSVSQQSNFNKNQYLGMAHKSVAQAILRTLTSANAMYQVDNGKEATKFSDFVAIDKTNNPYAIPINSFNKYTSRPITQNDLEGCTLQLIFNESNLKVTYYLNGSDVTADIQE